MNKTWSVVADKMGGHWHATVRRGQEGSRGKLGDLAFDLSDAEDFRVRITGIADVIMVRAVSHTLEQLGKDRLMHAMSGPALAELAIYLGETIQKDLHELVLAYLERAFGVRIDLAKVESDRHDNPDSREIVFAEPIEGLDGKYMVTLSCGHKKAVAEKRSHYACNECERPVSRMDQSCPKGLLCHHEQLCPGAVR